MEELPIAIVTGGAGGIGRLLVKHLSEDGYLPIVADRDIKSARDVVKELESTGRRAYAVEVDVTSEASTIAMAHELRDEFGRIDVLVNNAGLYGNPEWTGSLMDIPLDQWEALMAINLKGPLLCSRAVAPIMAARNWGRIVNISSQGAYKPAGAYAVTKLALSQLTWNLARDLGRFGVTVNGVGPGTMDLPNTHASRGQEAMARIAEAQIIPRLGQPSDVYSAVKYFISSEAEFCTAQTLLVNGGAVVMI